MKPVITWVLIADLQQARVLENQGAGTGLSQGDGHVYKAPPRSEYSDNQGRNLAGVTGGRVRMDRPVEYEPESIQFAKELSEMLLRNVRSHDFDRLIVCAGPSMLGLLRLSLSDELKHVIKAEIGSNLTNTPNSVIGKHLDGVITL